MTDLAHLMVVWFVQAVVKVVDQSLEPVDQTIGPRPPEEEGLSVFTVFVHLSLLQYCSPNVSLDSKICFDYI